MHIARVVKKVFRGVGRGKKSIFVCKNIYSQNEKNFTDLVKIKRG